jgi:hypothetical protein
MKPERGSGDRSSCPFHQTKGVDAGRGGSRIDGCHFGWRKEKVGEISAHQPIQFKKRSKNNRMNHQAEAPILCICLSFHRIEICFGNRWKI